MSLFFPRPAPPVERRDAFPIPSIPPNSEQGAFSLRRVDLSRADSALQKVAVFSAVSLIASISSTLPMRVYGSDGRELPIPSWLADIGGAGDDGGPGYGLRDWLWQVAYSMALTGNVVGRVIDRDPRYGRPRVVDLAHPDEVRVHRDQATGRPVWRVRSSEVPSSDIWHRRAFPTPGRILGLSPIVQHALTIGLGISAAQFGAQWFADGAHPSAILTNPNLREIGQQEARTIKDRFLSAIRGTREPAVLVNGWEYKPVQISPGESQFLETQKYTAAECARIYGPGMPEILGYESGNGMTYTNVEQRSLNLLTYTLDPWLVRIEEAVSSLLPVDWTFRFERKGLLRTDALTRFRIHEIALRNSVETVNEVRALEGLAPVPWGDDPRPNTTTAPTPVQVEGQ